MASIVEYINLVHQHGVGTKETIEFKEEHRDDYEFVRRANVFDALFLLSENED